MHTAKNKDFSIDIDSLIRYLDKGNEFEYSFSYTDVNKKVCTEYIKMYKKGTYIITEVGEKPGKDDIHMIDLENSLIIDGRTRLMNVINYDLSRGKNFKFSIIGSIVEALYWE